MRIGVDIGGTKILAALIDEDGSVCGNLRTPTPKSDYRKTIAAIKKMVDTLENEAGHTSTVGVCSPGALSRTSDTIKNANCTWLIGKPLRNDLVEILKRPIRLANDANCFALSESIGGAGEGARSIFGGVLSSGVGGGVIFNGHIVEGLNAICGEWGHNPLPWIRDDEHPGPLCYCGKYGCIETYLSGPGFEREYNSQMGSNLTADQIALLGENRDDPVAEECLRRYEDRLARALASVINIIDPDLIVLGGGMSKIGSLYEAVPKHLSQWVFSDKIDTRIVPSTFGDSSCARAAAMLWPVS